MLDGYYRNRLARDLEYWQSQGWLDKAGAEAILAANKPEQTGSRLPTILGFLGAVLIVFAAMSFVAANWDYIPRIARLILLLGGMAISYACAWLLVRRDYVMAGDAAILIGTGIYGAAIMLVAQIYHIEAHYPDGVLMWSLGAALAALLTFSRGALVVAIAGAGFWTLSEMLSFGWDVHWPFLPLWAALTLLSIVIRWSPAQHLTLMAILAWFVVAMGQIFELLDWSPSEALSLLMASAALLFAACHMVPRAIKPDGLPTLFLTYASSARFYALFSILALAFLTRLAGIEFVERGVGSGGLQWMIINLALIAVTVALAVFAWRQQTLRPVDIAAIIAASIYPLLIAIGIVGGSIDGNGLAVAMADAAFVLLLAVWSIDYGQHKDNRTALNLGLITFGIEILYLYFETFGSLLDTAFFFLTGGVLLIGLGWVLNKLRLRLASRGDAA